MATLRVPQSLNSLRPYLAREKQRVEQVWLRIPDRHRQRALALGLALPLQAILLALLLLGLHPRATETPHEITLTFVGGNDSLNAQTPKLPDLKDNLVETPIRQLDTTFTPTILASLAPSGTSDITRPSIALAESHELPKLPPGIPAPAKSVRLTLDVAADGLITGASVAESSSNPTLDALAVNWVKQHWRYQPAMEGGQAVATTTVAVVEFLSS